MRLTRLLLFGGPYKPQPPYQWKPNRKTTPICEQDWRKIWEVGYKGPSLPKKKGTDKPDLPVGRRAVAQTRARLSTEWDVMTCLASPYLTKEQESPWLSKYGELHEQKAEEKRLSELRRMPNKPKVVTGRTSYDRWRGNIGNLFHSPRTVEDELQHLIRRRRYE